jgi:hypothetical protein
MVAPPEHKAEEADLDELLRLSLDQHSLKTAVQEIMSLTGMSRKDVYARALALKGPQG